MFGLFFKEEMDVVLLVINELMNKLTRIRRMVKRLLGVKTAKSLDKITILLVLNQHFFSI